MEEADTACGIEALSTRAMANGQVQFKKSGKQLLSSQAGIVFHVMLTNLPLSNILAKYCPVAEDFSRAISSGVPVATT